MVKWRVDHLSPTLTLLTPHFFPCFYTSLLYGTPFHLLFSSTFIVLCLLHASFSHLSTHTLKSVALCAYSPLPLGSPALSLLPRLPDREGGRGKKEQGN